MPLSTRTALPFAFALLIFAATAFGEPPDLFVGKFVSEDRAHFGSDDPGEYVVDVSKTGDKYLLSYSNKGTPMFKSEAFRCLHQEGYLHEHPPGETAELCVNRGPSPDHPFLMPVMSYSENGIKVPPRATVYKAQYYVHVQSAIRGFRKVQ